VCFLRERRVSVARPWVVVLVALASTHCGSVLSAKYEYDEEAYLALDGSATIYVNASVPALVALRGAPLDVDSRARLDRNDVRAFFAGPGVAVESVSASRRDNRRYVHVRLQVDDIRRLSATPAFAWSQYSYTRDDRAAVFRQQVGPSAGRDVGDVGWSGREKVAFRLHLPSRVPFHNAPSREIERGNIIRWEQPLVDRLKGQPLAIEVHMEPNSILVQTLVLFAITAAAALVTMGLAVWWVVRRKGAELRTKNEERRTERRTKN
jgi:hypothetical protein